MARSVHHNCKNLVELIHCTPLPALADLAQQAVFAFFALSDPPCPLHKRRAQLLRRLRQLEPASIALAEHQAVRLLQLLQFHPEALLALAAREIAANPLADGASLDERADLLSQLICLYLHAPRLFERIEQLSQAQHFHGAPHFSGFVLHAAHALSCNWSTGLQHGFRALLGQARGVLIHIQEGDDDSGITRRQHYLLFFHPDPRASTQGQRYPAQRAATLVYDPAEQLIRVQCQPAGLAGALAQYFVRSMSSYPLHDLVLTPLQQDLSIFKHPFDLKRIPLPQAVITDAWLAELVMLGEHSPQHITLSLRGCGNDRQYAALHAGAAEQLARCRAIVAVKLSFVILIDGHSVSRALDLSLTQDGGCNLLALPDTGLRACGEAILQAIGVRQRTSLTVPSEERLLLRSVMALLERNNDLVDGALPGTWGGNADTLLRSAVLQPMEAAHHLLVTVDDTHGQAGFRRLKIKSDSSGAWACDPVTGQRYALSDGGQCQYRLDRPALYVLLQQWLQPYLRDIPLQTSDQEPCSLGSIALGDQVLPLLFVSRLWHAQHADDMDCALRLLNPGVCIVLTSAQQPARRFFGPGRVVALESVLQEHDGKLRVNFDRLKLEMQLWHKASSASTHPLLIQLDNNHAVLSGPWPEPWYLNCREHILVVAELLAKHTCTLLQLERAAGKTLRSLAECFHSAPQWRNYICGADHLRKHRRWRLNI
jgi:hypothetical protein